MQSDEPEALSELLEGSQISTFLHQFAFNLWEYQMGSSPSNPQTLVDSPGLGAHSTAVRGLGASDGILRETAMDQTPLWKIAIVPGHTVKQYSKVAQMQCCMNLQQLNFHLFLFCVTLVGLLHVVVACSDWCGESRLCGLLYFYILSRPTILVGDWYVLRER